MNHEAYITTTATWHGRTIELRAWADPSTVLWEDWELAEYAAIGAHLPERWDLALEVTLKVDGFVFKGHDAMCAVVEEEANAGNTNIKRLFAGDMLQAAILDMHQTMVHIANGSEVRNLQERIAAAQANSACARSVLAMLGELVVS